MKAQDFNIGDKFILKSRGYYHDRQPIVFVVTRIYADSISFINPADAVDYTLTDVNLDFYGDKVQIVERASDTDAINRVSVRLSGESLGKGEKEFAKTHKALEKAIREFRENKSIQFSNGRLTFISRNSGKQRNVTAFGCAQSCECGNGISYHKTLYAICEAVEKPKIQETRTAKYQEHLRAA